MPERELCEVVDNMIDKQVKTLLYPDRLGVIGPHNMILQTLRQYSQHCFFRRLFKMNSITLNFGMRSERPVVFTVICLLSDLTELIN